MENDELSRALEAVLLVAVEPVQPGLLAELLEEPVDRIEATLQELAAGYEAQGRGFVLARIAGGARLQTHPDLAAYVERFANRDVSHRLSTAALETLAIVAYRQPVVSGRRSRPCVASMWTVSHVCWSSGATSRSSAGPMDRANRPSSVRPISSWNALGLDSAVTTAPGGGLLARGPEGGGSVRGRHAGRQVGPRRGSGF